MCRRSTKSFALCEAFATPALGETQDIQVAEAPVGTGSRLEFFRLPWLLEKSQKCAESR